MNVKRNGKNITTEKLKLLDIAKELASRNSKPEPESEHCAKLALEAHKEKLQHQRDCDLLLIYMKGYLKREKERASQNSNPGPGQKTLQTIRKKHKRELKLINTARELASRDSYPEPDSEYYAKCVLKAYNYDGGDKRNPPFPESLDIYLNYMEIAVESENNRKKIETIAKKLASRNSYPEPQSERYAKLALEAHKEKHQKDYDLFLIYMRWYLKKEKKRGSQNSNPRPDQPTLQTLREKRKEETLKEQEIQPQIKQRRSR